MSSASTSSTRTITMARTPTPSSASSTSSSTKSSPSTGVFSSSPSCFSTYSYSSSARRDSLASLAPPVSHLPLSQACAFPSWPCGSTMSATKSFAADRRPSAYLSDEDLFGTDDEQYLSEPPPPPRGAEAWMAKPLLPPVHAVPAHPVHTVKPLPCRIEPRKSRTSSSGSGPSKHKE